MKEQVRGAEVKRKKEGLERGRRISRLLVINIPVGF